MQTSLTNEQKTWIDATLEKMSLEQCIGHLLCPEDRGYSPEEWRALASEIPLGCAFFKMSDLEKDEASIEAVQEAGDIPVLIAADMENGVGTNGNADFPHNMAFGAADNEDLAWSMGRALARSARSLGVHWSFSPVVDLNLNFQNPVTCTRAVSDDPERVIRIAGAKIAGMQHDNLLAATAKHFPGDGMDDRDQHLCTSVNPLPMDVWHSTYGAVWRKLIDAGVMTIMSGHISLPHYEDLAEDPDTAMPATLNHRLQVDLLRRELGFDGVLVSDAAPMIGITSRCPSNELAVQNILAGSDVFLFSHPREDFARLLEAVREGRLSETRVRESARRVLALKARLGLHKGVKAAPLTAAEHKEFADTSQQVADRSIAIARNDGHLPVRLPEGARVVCVDIQYENRAQDLTVVVDELRRRGFDVKHLVRPTHRELRAEAAEADMVFVNFAVAMHQRMGTIRMTDELIMAFWRSFWVDYPNAVFTSFGSPYVLHELPHLPNLVLAYSGAAPSQRAAVRVWLGEKEATGTIPVRLPETRDFVKNGTFGFPPAT